MVVALEHLPADILGLTPIARAALSGRPRPAALGGMTVPARLDDLDPDTATADSPFLERAELVDQLLAWREQRGPEGGLHPAQARNLERLADPRSQVVVCGQQPCLVGGPLFNLHKALHAVRLAAALEERWDRPVVPLFWCHSDDHDAAEAGHVHLLNRHLDVARVGVPGMGSGRTALVDLRLDREKHRLDAVREGLRQLLPVTEHRDPALDAWFPRHGEAFATAFVRGWEHVLGHTGLLFLEPAAIRTALSRALASIVTADLDGALAAATARLERAGLEAPLDPARTPWVFDHGDGTRRALRHADGAFRFDDEPGSRTGVELAARLVAEPERWSAGVLARPLVQDLCLPVAAYIGGWGELEYHALLPELRGATDCPVTPFCHRLAATLISPATGQSLERLDLDIRAALAARGLLRLAAQPEEKAPVIGQLRSVSKQNTADLMALRGPLKELDRGLAQQLKRSAKQAADLVEKVARKAERAEANRRGKSNRHYRRINNTLFGRETAQERLLTALQYVAAFGTDWIDALLTDIEPLPSEHLAVRLTSTGVQSE